MCKTIGKYCRLQMCTRHMHNHLVMQTSNLRNDSVMQASYVCNRSKLTQSNEHYTKYNTEICRNTRSNRSFHQYKKQSPVQQLHSPISRYSQKRLCVPQLRRAKSAAHCGTSFFSSSPPYSSLLRPLSQENSFLATRTDPSAGELSQQLTEAA